MAVKLTKSELKLQKDRLKQFRRYLPTLELKKQQLQLETMQIEERRNRTERDREEEARTLEHWIAVFSENRAFPADRKIDSLVRPDRVLMESANIAGVTIPVFRELTFHDIAYDAGDYPLWVDTALKKLRDIAAYDAKIAVYNKQMELLEKELRSTTQRVNLFEKVMIPQALENIRVIGIYLGDQQTAEVVRGKIAKKKLEGAAE